MARIETEQQLRDIYAEPKGRAVTKVFHRLEEHSRRFISLSPFVMIATQGPDGADVSPKGDLPGFIQVLDDVTVAIPDRPGNNRLDGYANILKNPAVGLIFLIPGINETFRINGTGEIRDDADLLAKFEVSGKLPKSCLVVTVQEAFMHCAKAFMRSRLWDPEARVPRDALPTAAEMMRGQTGDQSIADESTEAAVARYKKELF
ncbi:MAG: phosphohydrolase [Rhodospirillaceae bacterium]|nr:phosphohydrolase [Magnetovibrio sp.]MAY67290.1 phosphohydrolase [Rhodospirillaceae bacterium]